jgi:dihydrofolate synthase / folylpolyglutamate synthase
LSRSPAGRAGQSCLPEGQAAEPVGQAYQEAVAALEARGRFGIRLGLARTRALLAALGDPQLGLRGALVAGTNGKGSVLALASAAARAAGLRVGTTPKPHLVSYRERLQIDDRLVDRVTFSRLVGEVLTVADAVARRHGEPTEFELLTAMIFRWFAEQDIDLALIEVGLGGRLDATHAWDGGVAVVTNVALDHMAQLGSTIPRIAREKAAIIERGDIAVTGATGDGLAVVRRRADRLGVPLSVAPPPRLLGWDRDGIDVALPALGPTRVGLRGRHQADNVAVADALLDGLAAAGIAEVPPDARRAGYAAASWPGRLELVEVAGTEVLLDGAHNPAGAAALAQALDDLRPYLAGGARPAEHPLTLVHGSMADKDVDGVIDALASAAAMQGAAIVATQVSGSRAMPAGELARRWTASVGPEAVSEVRDAGAAIERAIKTTRGPVVVAGSLYLVGEARRRLLGGPDDEPARPGTEIMAG